MHKRRFDSCYFAQLEPIQRMGFSFTMKLYLLSQQVRTGYDTYDSCVVAANSEEEARHISPNGEINTSKEADPWDFCYYTWCIPEKVTVEEIGTAHPSIKKGVICASFNAG